MDKKEELCKDRFEQAKVADVMRIYDNSTVPYRIFKKRKTESFIWENENWGESAIKELTGTV